MENNLLYKDYNIFTKIPQIYLNLNTTITKNLNVFKNTIIHKNLDVYQNTNISQNLNVKSNVNITHNLITHKNIIGLSSLYVDKDSQFKSNFDDNSPELSKRLIKNIELTILNHQEMIVNK